MNISKFVKSYLSEPFIIWEIFFTVITNLVFIPIFFDLVKWILDSQIYLAIFIPSFAFLYLKHSLPITKVKKEIKKAQHQNHWVVPQIMSNKMALDISLWLGGVIFFAHLMISFGLLDHNAIRDKELYSKLEIVLPLVGFGLARGMSDYFSWRIDKYFQQLKIEICKKIDPETMIPIISLFFFGTLSYVSAVNIL